MRTLTTRLITKTFFGRASRRIVAASLILVAVVALVRLVPWRHSPSLVQIELKDKNGGDFIMRATELERSDKTSKIKIVFKKRIGSVGSSMGVIKAFYDIAKSRKCEYFANLKEWNDEDGSRIYIGGFTNKKDADLKKEFGEQFDYNNESGQKRMLLNVSQFAPMLENLHLP